MVGGEVIEVLRRRDRVWVNARCRTNNDTCAIYVERTPEAERIKVGDQIWWQGRKAMWTPAENRVGDGAGMRCGVDFDIEIPRIGYSGVAHPAAKMVRAAYGDDR